MSPLRSIPPFCPAATRIIRAGGSPSVLLAAPLPVLPVPLLVAGLDPLLPVLGRLLRLVGPHPVLRRAVRAAVALRPLMPQAPPPASAHVDLLRMRTLRAGGRSGSTL